MFLHVLSVAQLVLLQVFPQLGGVQEDDLLAEEAGCSTLLMPNMATDTAPKGVCCVAESKSLASQKGHSEFNIRHL